MWRDFYGLACHEIFDDDERFGGSAGLQVGVRQLRLGIATRPLPGRRQSRSRPAESGPASSSGTRETNSSSAAAAVASSPCSVQASTAIRTNCQALSGPPRMRAVPRRTRPRRAPAPRRCSAARVSRLHLHGHRAAGSRQSSATAPDCRSAISVAQMCRGFDGIALLDEPARQRRLRCEVVRLPRSGFAEHRRRASSSSTAMQRRGESSSNERAYER